MHSLPRMLGLVLSVLSVLVFLDSVHASPSAQPRDLGTATDNINTLNNCNVEMAAHTQVLHCLVQEPASSRSADFVQEFLTELLDFLEALQSFQDTLTALSDDKGLANYELGDLLVTVLRNAVSSSESVVADTQAVAGELPVIGPLLGPLLQDLGNLLSSIETTAQNLPGLVPPLPVPPVPGTNAIVNAIEPSLENLINNIFQLVCGLNPGAQTPGLCPVPQS